MLIVGVTCRIRLSAHFPTGILGASQFAVRFMHCRAQFWYSCSHHNNEGWNEYNFTLDVGTINISRKPFIINDTNEQYEHFILGVPIDKWR